MKNTVRKPVLNVEEHRIIKRFFQGASFTVLDMEGQLWFKLNEITDSFGIDRSAHATYRLYDGETAKIKEQGRSGNNTTIAFSEAGLIHMIFSMNPANARGISE